MKKATIILILALIEIVLKAQNMPYKHYTVADKLPSNICYRIIQDQKGFIWVATEKGIAIFDGYSFKPIYTKNKLRNLDIWGLIKDNENRIWLTSKQNQSMYIFEDSVYNINESQKTNDKYTALINYGATTIIFKSKPNDNYIYEITDKHQLVKREISAILKEKILSIHKLNQSVFSNVTASELTLLSSGGELLIYSFKTKKIQNNLFKSPIKALLHTKSVTENMANAFYFSSSDSIYRIQNNKIQFINTYSKSGISNDAICVGVSNRNFFFRLENKLFGLDSNWNSITINLPTLQALVSQIFEDKEHNLWFVTIGNGIYFASSKTLQNKIYLKENGLLDNHILSLYKHTNNSVLLGYYSQDKFQYLKNDKLYTIPKSLGIASSLLVFDQGDFLLSDQYISKKPIEVKYNMSKIPSTQTKKEQYYINQLNLGIKSVHKLNEQQCLVGSRNVLLLFTKKNNTLTIDSLTTTKAFIYSIATLGDSILIGTPDGLNILENKILKFPDGKAESLLGNIRAILIDEEKNIWITSDNGNLNCYDTNLKPIISFPKINGLVTSLYLDSFDNKVLASCSDGLYAIDLKSPHNYIYYSVADGLPSNEVNATVSDKDYIYVATSSGLGILKKKIYVYRNNPMLYCTKMFINNVEKSIHVDEELHYKDNNIRLQLAALSYQSLGKIDYFYRFKNIDTTWTSIKQPQLEFSSLKPGKYELEIYAKDVNNVITANTIYISFSILPPFWKTTWFYISLTLLLSGLLVLAIYYWLHRSKKKALKEMNFKKELAEVKLNALQSQLNSHFIYNSLNAIQNFILNKDVIEANEYLSKFAKLIRLFLESSRSTQAPLMKEIELIRIYTSLEKLRFEDKFEVIISHEKINNIQIDFPTNMVQPFVENAIVHGLLLKPSKGLLTIIFSETVDEIICQIEDDGIGRIKSGEINKTRKIKSIGMDIIQDKIINIGTLQEKKIIVEIIDKTMKTHFSSGTLVIIRYKK